MDYGDLCGVQVGSCIGSVTRAELAKGSLFCPRDFLSEDDNDKKQNTQSSDESFEPYPEKK